MKVIEISELSRGLILFQEPTSIPGNLLYLSMFRELINPGTQTPYRQIHKLLFRNYFTCLLLVRTGVSCTPAVCYRHRVLSKCVTSFGRERREASDRRALNNSTAGHRVVSSNLSGDPRARSYQRSGSARRIVLCVYGRGAHGLNWSSDFRFGKVLFIVLFI